MTSEACPTCNKVDCGGAPRFKGLCPYARRRYVEDAPSAAGVFRPGSDPLRVAHEELDAIHRVLREVTHASAPDECSALDLAMLVRASLNKSASQDLVNRAVEWCADFLVREGRRSAVNRDAIYAARGAALLRNAIKEEATPCASVHASAVDNRTEAALAAEADKASPADPVKCPHGRFPWEGCDKCTDEVAPPRTSEGCPECGKVAGHRPYCSVLRTGEAQSTPDLARAHAWLYPHDDPEGSNNAHAMSLAAQFAAVRAEALQAKLRSEAAQPAPYAAAPDEAIRLRRVADAARDFYEGQVAGAEARDGKSEIRNPVWLALRDALARLNEKHPAPCSAEAPRESVVWADEATPFTGPQVLALLRENEALRKPPQVVRWAVWRLREATTSELVAAFRHQDHARQWAGKFYAADETYVERLDDFTAVRARERVPTVTATEVGTPKKEPSDGGEADCG